jgi:DNA-binding winged helix-turn-helix (wHTH) protein/TolB-like protein
MQVPSRRIYEFGPFRLDAGEHLLLKDGRPVSLSPKAFDTLLVLVENRGHLVQKEDLMSSVWPDAVVEENSLNRSIYVLRKALGESDGGPKYIETVPKRGYRFVAGVVDAQADETALIMERHTSSEIVTEEEEISETPAAENVESANPAVRTAARASSRLALRVNVASMSALVALAVVAGLVSWWVVEHKNRAASVTRINSIAVLPFRDISATGDDHLGVGLADVLITRLSGLKGVNVRPTSAVLKFEGPEQEPAAAGRLLGVDAVLEGSIYRSGDKVRVTARFVRVTDGSPIWSGQFDNRVREALSLENEIAEQLTGALTLNLAYDEKTKRQKPFTESADALELYAKGRYYWNTRTLTGLDKAEYMFRRAIEKDPNFALAYVGLADRLLLSRPPGDAFSAAQKAIELDPDLGEAYASLGFELMFHEWNWREAEKEFGRAIELRPGYGTAHQWYATLLAITGRFDEAKRQMQKALEIDPMSPNFLADTGQMYYFTSEFDQAEAYCRKALEVAPDFVFAHLYLSDIYIMTGRDKDAIDEALILARSYAVNPEFTNTRAARNQHSGASRLEPGLRGFLKRRIDEFVADPLPGYCYQLARANALLGDKDDQALGWLERSYENKDFLLPFINADPAFSHLRDTPRYKAILTRMNLM